MARKDEGFIEQNKQLRKLISTDNEEFSTIGGLSPLKRYVRTFIRVEKFKNLDDMVNKLIKMSIQDDEEMEEEYMNSKYSKLDDDDKDNIKEMIISLYDSEQNELAYARSVFQASKVLGLINVSGKDLDYYHDNSLMIQERDIWNTFTSTDLIDFPQYLTQDEMIRNILKNMDSDFYGKVLDMMVDMDDSEKDTMITLLQVSDMASDVLGVVANSSNISIKFSDIRKGSNLIVPEDDEDDMDDENDMFDKIESDLVPHLMTMGMSKKTAKKQSSSLIDDLEIADPSIRQLQNIKFLLERKHNALYTKNNEEDIVASLDTTAFYLSPDAESRSDKTEAASLILPLAMISRITEETLGELLDIDELDDAIIYAEADDDFEPDEMSEEFEDLDEAVAMDLSLGLNIGTFLYGVIKKENYYKELAKNTIPKLSIEILENFMTKEYSDKIDAKLITKFLTNEHKSYKNRSDLILESVQAIKSALDID